jgi:hypothetical protein
MSKTFFKIANILLLLSLITSCTEPEPAKTKPDYTGVDPRAQALVDEFMWLSKQNHIQFTHTVTLGFKDIDHGMAVGICTYAPYFREIDLDVNYWNNTSNTTHAAMVFHELTHCYCARGHDYGENLQYPPTESERTTQALKWRLEGGQRPGYLDDGCPTTFMYPIVLDDECTLKHYSSYVQEMFDRCEPF